MTSQEVLSDGFTKLLGDASDSIRIRYFTQTVGSVWDDEVTLTGGNLSNQVAFTGGSPTNWNGAYIESGTFGGEPVYTNEAGSGILFYQSVEPTADKWYIGEQLDFAAYWQNSSTSGTFSNVACGGTMVGVAGDASAVWVSGIVQPVTAPEGSTEAVLVNQGKLSTADTRLYVNGSIAFNGSTFTVDVMVGSPAGDLYSTIQGGVDWPIASTPVYTKQYIRRLTGSLSDNQ